VGNLGLAGDADRYLLACAVFLDYWTQWTARPTMITSRPGSRARRDHLVVAGDET
jgi:hypothetical protein